MTEENKTIQDLDDLQNAFDESCGHRQWLFARYNDAYSDGFRSGQVDLQIKAKKILDTFDKWEADELVNVFGVSTNIELLNDIKTNYEKIINYENEKEEIHVGDVVTQDGYNYIVIDVYDNDNTLAMITKSGAVITLHKNYVKKTGKHYPIDEMLKELE